MTSGGILLCAPIFKKLNDAIKAFEFFDVSVIRYNQLIRYEIKPSNFLSLYFHADIDDSVNANAKSRSNESSNEIIHDFPFYCGANNQTRQPAMMTTVQMAHINGSKLNVRVL